MLWSLPTDKYDDVDNLSKPRQQKSRSFGAAGFMNCFMQGFMHRYVYLIAVSGNTRCRNDRGMFRMGKDFAQALLPRQ